MRGGRGISGNCGGVLRPRAAHFCVLKRFAFVILPGVMADGGCEVRGLDNGVIRNSFLLIFCFVFC